MGLCRTLHLRAKPKASLVYDGIGLRRCPSIVVFLTSSVVLLPPPVPVTQTVTEPVEPLPAPQIMTKTKELGKAAL